MIEVMGRILARLHFDDENVGDASYEEFKSEWDKEAAAVIKAMRDPTTEMVLAGSCGGDWPHSRETWVKMINAALVNSSPAEIPQMQGTNDALDKLVITRPKGE